MYYLGSLSGGLSVKQYGLQKVVKLVMHVDESRDLPDTPGNTDKSALIYYLM